MEFDDFITTQVRIYPDCEKHCRLVEAEYTCEAKYVYMLTESEKHMVLGGLECVRGDDYAVRIKYKDHSVTFNSGREYILTEYDWAIVNKDKIDGPIRLFRYYEDANDLVMVQITGEARLAIDMFRRSVKEDNRVKMFLKDWQQMRSWPCYNLDLIGAGMICSLKPGASHLTGGQVCLYKTKGRLLYGLILPWTKKKRLFVPLSRYNHPADNREMWTERYLYNKEDAMFRAVYLLWNTQIIDYKTAVYSWHAYDVSQKEMELVLQMLDYIYDPDGKEMPINASPRVGAPAGSWVDYNHIHPRAHDALVNHRDEARAELMVDFVFTEQSRLLNNRGDTCKTRLHQLADKCYQPELFAQDETND